MAQLESGYAIAISKSKYLWYNPKTGQSWGFGRKYGGYFGKNDKGSAKVNLPISDIRITASTHLVVTAPWKERFSQDIFASSKGDFKVEQLEFTGEALESMGESVKMAMENMYNAALNAQAYDTLSNLFPEDYQD